MFGNNINGPFMSPNISYDSMIRSVPMINTTSIGMQNAPMIGMGGSSIMTRAPRTGGFLSSLLGGRGTEGFRSFNFGSLLNNASKALGVVKEAIPIVKEVGPMVGNMKSMLKIASVFKDETDSSSTRTSTTTINKNTTLIEDTNTNENDTRISSINTTQTLTSGPNFFL